MEKIFVNILHMGISGSYLILAVLAVRFLLKSAPKTMRVFLWLLVGIRLLMPFSIESAFSLIPDTQPVEERIYNLGMQKQAENTGMEAVQELQSPLPATDKLQPENSMDAGTPLYLRLGTGIWIAGMVIMAGYMIVSWVRLTNRVRTAVPVEVAAGRTQKVKVYQSERIDSPFLFGIIRPRIYIPGNIADGDISYVVLHEKTHRERKDYLIKIAGFLILGAYWFHPLVWIAYIMLCRDIELICDEQVIRELGEQSKKAYSQALLASAVNHRMISACPVAFGEIGIRERVKNVLNYKKPALWIIIVAVLACVMVPVCFMTKQKAGILKEDAHSLAGIYDMAVSEEVVSDAHLTEVIDIQNREEIERWAQAFCSRDGKTIANMLDEGADQELADKCNFIRLEDGSVEFGFSSPWPWAAEDESEAAPNYRIVRLTDASAEILYYAWVSDPHVTVWRERLAYKMEDGRCVITSESIQFMDYICTTEEFEWAYPDRLIAGTMMDYYSYNGAGETLNGRGADDRLLQPDTAAVYLLNLLDNQNKVSTKVLKSDTDENACTVEITFHLSKEKTVKVTMIRPYGEDGIWVPYN